MTGEMTHMLELAEKIGPRPATTDAEAAAADYIQRTFEARGLEVERQEFDSPRTYGWAYVAYHLLTIGAAVLARWFPWPALLIAALSAVLMRFDLNSRWGLTSLMPKGPSQNIIARYMPRVRRNERTHKVIVVAHYDSARSSLAFSPGMVRNFSTTFGLMKALTVTVPVLIALSLLPWLAGFRTTWSWYVILGASAYLLIPLLINIHRELFMRFVDGANDNASGVAAMLGVMERVVPEPEAGSTMAFSRVRDQEEETPAADAVSEEAWLAFAPAGTPRQPDLWAGGDDDIDWTEPASAGRGQTTIDMPAPAATPAAPAPAAPTAPVSAVPGPTPAEVPAPPPRSAATTGDLFGTEDLWTDAPPASAALSARETPVVTPALSVLPSDPSSRDAAAAPERRGLFGGSKKEPSKEPAQESTGKSGPERRGVRDWLGVNRDFDARDEGRQIGSWDNFNQPDGNPEDEEAGFKGGAAATDDPADDGYVASSAARIRRKVTFGVDRDLSEKEVWFVATGAEEVGTIGMKAFLKEHGPDLKDAFIINIDNVGTGTVVYVDSEGMAKRYRSDRRLTGAARRAISENGLTIRGHDYKGLSTDATPALARGYRAMSVMAFDINGRLPNWHWETDTVSAVEEQNLTAAAEFVCAVIKEL
jgi:hypothetical protein